MNAVHRCKSRIVEALPGLSLEHDSIGSVILWGHVLDAWRRLPSNSLHTVITSPPYWGLRNYGTEPQVWGGDPECEHVWGPQERTAWASRAPGPNGRKKNVKAAHEGKQTKLTGPFCQKCGAWRGDLGLEPTPELYVRHIVEVFEEVRRVLRPDGTLWLNIGDCYAATGGAGRQGNTGQRVGRSHTQENLRPQAADYGLKPKDLVGIPWMVAFALRAAGWYLRSDIIWSKPNPMPESVKDRPTKSHEYLFLFTKSERYFYNYAAIRETAVSGELPAVAGWASGPGSHSTIEHNASREDSEAKFGQRPQLARALQLAKEAGLTEEHIAAVRAVGLSDAGKAAVTQSGAGKNSEEVLRLAAEAKEVLNGYTREFLGSSTRNARTVWTIATQPFPEAHFATFPLKLVEPCILAGCPQGGIVGDPFVGSGTVPVMSARLGCDFVGSDLKQEYASMSANRIHKDNPLFNVFRVIDVKSLPPLAGAEAR